MKETYKGYEYEIEQDEYPENPREAFDGHLGTIYYGTDYHKKLGDTMVDGWDGLSRELGLDLDYYEDNEDKVKRELDKNYIWIETGMSSLNICIVSKNAVRKEYGWKLITKSRHEEIEKYLQAEVKEFESWCNGEVYCHNITKDGDLIDSCCGFYGYEYCEQDAIGVIENDIKWKLKERIEKIKYYIRGNVPLIYRTFA